MLKPGSKESRTIKLINQRGENGSFVMGKTLELALYVQYKFISTHINPTRPE